MNMVLKFFDADLDPDPVWKKFGSGIQDKHPGSAVLQKFMPNTESFYKLPVP
jgi:hypothetical protein